ncbi:MAG: SEC-C domain-containing protein [Deltaproteobacteria bacterium]|nr:SEC-C domain-containing protein [Deltaproteobacteria bacterium]MBW1928588.1 SEC-C domain-containing protein [Deltaproteobacteria bacterium]MBW2026426.1 SEC-C domain-containing protein [Deltaproteobacteria bacterium]MBW2126892.1 SEC-C domain-containing protein [Deltaproteobacteria bacterium]RLB19918.1 MAG: hypothetical protein DRG76_12090 [Deltaproteobacteria bacterium]
MKIGRNDPCPCGSGKKYKKCCLNKQQPPEDLLYRRLSDTYNKLVDRLLDFADRVYGPEAMGVALGEFLFWEEKDSLEEALSQYAPAFIPWFLFNWSYDPEDCPIELDAPAFSTIAQTYAAEMGPKLETLEKRLIEASVGRPFSFYEVVSSNPGFSFRLKDILTGKHYDVTEKMGSEGTRPGDILFARIIPIDHIHMMVGCGPFLIPPGRKPTIIQFRRFLSKRTGSITKEDLVEYDAEIRDLYFDIYEALSAPPQLRNTDGDPILFHKLTYEIEDPEEAFEALCSLCATEDPATLRQSASLDKTGRILKIEYPWSRKGHKLERSLDNTVLGNISIDGRKMTIEVNSEQRANTIRKEIEARLGDRARYKAMEITPLESMMKEAKAGGGKGTKDHDDLMEIPEVREKLEQMMAQHWDDWIDEEIPALGGKTPRQAVKTRDGRESVEALLLDAQRHAARDRRMGEFELACIKEVQKKLGLDRPLKLPRVDKKREQQKAQEIAALIEKFGRTKLDPTHTELATKLCHTIAKSPDLALARGRPEIWASGILYAIAQLNFLFDPSRNPPLTPDEICAFFGTKKATVSNKALLIRQTLDLGLGDEEFCTPEIADLFRFYETEDGTIIPGFMLEEDED